MGLGDFILIIDKLGLFGLVIVFVFIVVMFVGAIVDIFQFWWVISRLKKKRHRSIESKIRAKLLLELHEKELKK